jgi:hypothetical protein
VTLAKTATSEVSVTFAVTFDFERYYTEAELSAADVVDRIRAASTIEGSIEIAGSGGPPITIVDELAPWIQNLCFRAVSTVASGEPAHVLYFSRSGFLDLVPRDDVVEVSGDKNPNAVYPRRQLLEALVECGSRFLAFAETTKHDDADYIGNLNYVRQFEEPARAAATDS